MAAYLRGYAEMLDLNVRSGVEVTGVTKRTGGGGWAVETGQGTVFGAKFVVVACGEDSVPRVPEFDGRDAFAGTVIHSSDYFSGSDGGNGCQLTLTKFWNEKGR